MARVTRFQGDSGTGVTHENVTERKLAELELEQYHHHLQELVSERTVELERASREEAESANRAQAPSPWP